MIALVCGGREYGLGGELAHVLSELDPRLVIHGNARGADTLAHRWAISTERSVLAMPARWATEGKGAGPRRNGRMLKAAQQFAELWSLPLLVVAFPGGAGTANMVKRAKAAGVDVMEVET